MKTDPTRESLYERFLRWAGGEEADGPEGPEDPARQEFQEYLEYMDAHGEMDFGAYRLMRWKERRAKGLIPDTAPAPHSPDPVPPDLTGQEPLRHRPGRLKKQIKLYWALSAAVTLVLAAVFLVVALELPAFGDPSAPALNEVSERYLERGAEETGAVNAVTGMILDYRAFDTFGESAVLFAAASSTILLLNSPRRHLRTSGTRPAHQPAGAVPAAGDPPLWRLCGPQRPPEPRGRILRGRGAGGRIDPGLSGAGGGADGAAAARPPDHGSDGGLPAGLWGDEGVLLLHRGQSCGLGRAQGDPGGAAQRRADPAIEHLRGDHRGLHYVHLLYPVFAGRGGDGMIETLLQQRYYVAAVVLFSIGFVTLFLHPNLIKKIIGMNLMDTAVFLFLAAMGYVDGGKAPMVEPGAAAEAYVNPVPGGLVLTGIVVAVSTTALFLALTHRLYRKYHSLNLDVILMLAREGGEKNDH